MNKQILKINGYDFKRAGKLQYESFDNYPEEDYDNENNIALNRYGEGPFCKFRLDALPSQEGVYLWVLNDAIIYIGKAQDLRQRFNVGYGNISPRNCYVGGQSTNCKMNKVALENRDVSIYYFTTSNPMFNRDIIEMELIRLYNPAYNVQGNY